MNVYEIPKLKLADFNAAVKYFKKLGYQGTPELRLISYTKGKDCHKAPAWVGKLHGIETAVPIFKNPARIDRTYTVKIDSQIMGENIIYFDEENIYISLLTDDGLAFRKLNVIYNKMIADCLGSVISNSNNYSFDILCFEGYDKNNQPQKEYYWVGFPIDITLAESTPTPKIPVFLSGKNIELDSFVIDDVNVLTSKDTIFKEDTFWEIVLTQDYGKFIRVKQDLQDIYKKCLS